MVALGEASFEADVSRETLRVTTLGAKRVGARVNLEPALRVGDTRRSHGVRPRGWSPKCSRTSSDARSCASKSRAELARYIARKGSVTLDGVSLTVNDVQGRQFTVNLIPHTTGATHAHGSGGRRGRLNLEVDLLARYVERLVRNPS